MGTADADVVDITAMVEETRSTSKCLLRTLISRAATRDSINPPLHRQPLLPAKRRLKAVRMRPLLLDRGHRALRRRRRSRRRITRRSRSLIPCLRLLRRLALGDRALGLVVHRDMVELAVAGVAAVDVVEVGVIDAKRKERRMWRRLESLVVWDFLVLVDMLVDGEDMVGEAAGHDVVEVVVVGAEVEVEEEEEEVRRLLFRPVYERVLFEEVCDSLCLLFGGKGRRRRRNDVNIEEGWGNCVDNFN